MTCVGAFTAFTGYVNYPPYISINARREGFVEVHVRSPESLGSKEATIELSDVDFDKLIRECAHNRGML